MLNLRTLYGAQPDLRQFVKDLTQWVIRTLVSLGVEAGTHPQHVGIWIGQQKIAALGIRLHKWVSYHGIAININPDMTFFESIVPCGISDLGVGSLASLGYHIDMQAFDTALLESFPSIFNIDIESVTDESIV
jgi:lipoyl(octanoyl) transferase